MDGPQPDDSPRSGSSARGPVRRARGPGPRAGGAAPGVPGRPRGGVRRRPRAAARRGAARPPPGAPRGTGRPPPAGAAAPSPRAGRSCRTRPPAASGRRRPAPGRGRPAPGARPGRRSPAGTANRRLKRGRKARSTAFAAGRSQAPARRSSETRRSWSVPQARSIRPLACADPARMVVIPSSARARPTWVASSRPGPSGPVGAKTDAAVPVQGGRQAVPAGHVAQHGQVPDAVLLLAEHGPDEDPGRVVDPAHQGEPGPAALEPVVPAAVDLDEQARLGHALAPAAVPGPRRVRGEGIPEARSRRCRAGRLMAIPSSSASASARWVSLYPRYTVRASSRTRSRSASGSRRGDARPRLPWASPAAPPPHHRGPQPPGGPLAAAQQGDRLGRRDDPGQPAAHDPAALLLLGAQRQALPHQVRLTKSLSSCP